MKIIQATFSGLDSVVLKSPIKEKPVVVIQNAESDSVSAPQTI